MTPEEFFRSCDLYYKKEVSTTDFIKKVKEAELGLNER